MPSGLWIKQTLDGQLHVNKVEKRLLQFRQKCNENSHFFYFYLLSSQPEIFTNGDYIYYRPHAHCRLYKIKISKSKSFSILYFSLQNWVMMMVSWLVTVLLVRDVLMDNLQDLMIIDSLLKNYDRRATPTNRMGRDSIVIASEPRNKYLLAI